MRYLATVVVAMSLFLPQIVTASTPKALEGVDLDSSNELSAKEADNIRGTWQCTEYVKLITNIAISGNAKDWYGNAKSRGYSVSRSTPKAKSIMVIGKWNDTDGKNGHVAYIKSVEKLKNGTYKLNVTHANWNKPDTGVAGNDETSTAIYNSKTGTVQLGKSRQLGVNGFITSWRRK